jgi:hypothetical protein
MWRFCFSLPFFFIFVKASADGRVDANEVITACSFYNIPMDLPTAGQLLFVIYVLL